MFLVAGVGASAAAAAASPLTRLRLREELNGSVSASPLGGPNDACSFNGFGGACQTVSTCGGTSIAGKCPGPDDVQCCIKQDDFQPGCGKAAIQRAMEWVNMELLYCQSANGQPDGDPDCPSTCVRAHDKRWDGYRSDCSGFASWAYGVPAPGRTTRNFAPYQTDASFALDSPLDLQTGDLINSVPDEHIMLFVRWLNDAHTSAELLEEPGCSASPPYARITRSDVSITSDGLLFVSQNGMSFKPIRMHTNSPPC
jgi:hypothetical protein